jgi:histidine triad (HIT) family protein
LSSDPTCVFCKIVAGAIPCFKLFEDADTIAFMDINPGNDGHALAIPKAHHRDLFALPPALLAATARTAQRVALAVHKALGPDGINLVQANGKGAEQSVFHFHLHVLPRRVGDGLALNWGHRPGDMARIQAVYEKIKAAM